LDVSHLSPGDVIADELGFQLAEIVETPGTVDEISIRNGVCRTREEIGQADLITHACRNHDQCRIEESGNLLEEIAEQCFFRNVRARGRTYLTSNVPSIPLSRWLGRGQRRLSQ